MRGQDISFGFGSSIVQTFLDNLVDVVAAMVTTFDHTIDDVPFTHALEQLIAANIPVDAAPVPLEPQPTLAQAFSDSVIAYHDLPVLLDGDVAFTYREVDFLTSFLSRRILESPK